MRTYALGVTVDVQLLVVVIFCILPLSSRVATSRLITNIEIALICFLKAMR